MKKLERSEMKNLKGGYFDDGGPQCKSVCYKWNGSSMDNGTCTYTTQTVGGVVLGSCDCSLAGASSCANTPMA